MPPRVDFRPAVLIALARSACVWGLFGCAAPPPRVAHPARPLDEQRAIQIIVESFRDESGAPVSGSVVALSPRATLEVDVRAQGHKYGVAYVTVQERTQLGAALPPRDPARGDALQLVSGVGADGDARVLLLYDTDYLYDDYLGEGHQKSAVTAELKLRRDVRDFLVRANSERWP